MLIKKKESITRTWSFCWMSLFLKIFWKSTSGAQRFIEIWWLGEVRWGLRWRMWKRFNGVRPILGGVLLEMYLSNKSTSDIYSIFIFTSAYRICLFFCRSESIKPLYNVKEIYHWIIILNKLKCLTVCFKVN